MNNHHRSFPKNLSWLFLYALALVLVVALWLFFREPAQEEPAGTLEGRFDSSITYAAGDTTLHYREAALTNLLLLGVDREGDTPAAVSSQEGGQADFLLLITTDREHRRITLTHIDRDTMVTMDTYGVFGDKSGTITTQLCLSHAFGATEVERCQNTVEALSGLLGGIVIDGYVAMDMRDIGDFNDALGGVTVTLEDDFSMVDSAMTKGSTLTLEGKQAEIFIRYRSMVANPTNESRMKRQRMYMTSALEMLEGADTAFLNSLLETMGDRLCTNLTAGELGEYLNRWNAYDKGDIQTMEGVHALDEEGFVAFHPDEVWLEQYITETFFQ